MNKKKIITVGIMEEKCERTTFKYIEQLLLHSNYEILYSNLNNNIVGFNNGDDTILVMDIVSEKLQHFEALGIKFNILIHTFLDKEDYNSDFIKHQFANCDYCVINCDEENWTSMLSESTNGIVITYGFNSKAAVTVSSYNINQGIEANLCLQREINQLDGKKSEPFEIPIKMDSHNKDDIYPGLASATLSMILGNNGFLNNTNKIFKSNSR